MIRRTSDEKIINMKVNISDARAFFPDTKRCLNPELNTEIEKTKVQQTPATMAEKLKHGNNNLISGESMSALDERVKNKLQWKVGLINKYENNQQMWGELTNSFVNKLKEEVHYEPSRDFRKENEVIDEKLAKKLEIMQEQCVQHKANMNSNPITGQRGDSQSVSRRKQSQYAQEMNRSDIHSLRKFGGQIASRETAPAKQRDLQGSTSQSNLRGSVQATPGRRNREQWAETANRSSRSSHMRSASVLSHSQRDLWAK